MTRLTAAISAPPASLNDLRYITQQVEWFYSEMFIGMTVLYGFIAAVFGYFIPQHNLRELHKKIDIAKDEARKASDAIDAAKLNIVQQEVKLNQNQAQTQHDFEKVNHVISAVLRFGTGLTIYVSGARQAEILTFNRKQPSQNPTLVPAIDNMLTASHEFFLAEDRRAFGSSIHLSIHWLKEFNLSPIPQPLHKLIVQVQKDYNEAVSTKGFEATEELKLSEEDIKWFLELPIEKSK